MARILYFGRLADVCGCGEEEVDMPADVKDTDALRRWLDSGKGASGSLLERSVRVVVNEEIVREPAAVADDDVIAFLPPVGGG